jgi:sulfite reductase (ferredoxin)
LLGGGNKGNGNGLFADKVVKIPARRGPQALRLILDDYEANGNGVSYEDYYAENGQLYFYDFLKPLSDVDNLTDEDFIDWGTTERYEKAIGIGECAGVVIDLVATLLFESEEKIANAQLALEEGKWAAAIYHSYSSMVNSAKALLTSEDVKTNTHSGIISDFQARFVESGKIDLGSSFEEIALQLKNNPPTSEFATAYMADAREFLAKAEAYRKQELIEA